VADTSFESLARRLDNLSRKLEANTESAIQKAAIVADQVVVIGTPFDLGRARGGWQVTFGAPADGETGILDPTGQATIARNTATILSFRVGKSLFLSNAVPYIARLNAGSSPQNKDFARDAAEAALAFLRKFKFL
jgi:hypothetical protein